MSSFSRQLSFLIAVLICTPVAVFADRYDPLESPVRWIITIQNSENVTTEGPAQAISYEDNAINILTQTTIINKTMDVSCQLRFYKQIYAHTDGSAPSYTEHVAVKCQVGKVYTQMNNVSCGNPAFKGGRIDSGELTLSQWPATLEINVICALKPVKPAQ